MRISIVVAIAFASISSGAQPWYGDRGPKDVQVHLLDANGAPVAGVEVACVPRDHSGAPRLTPLADYEKAVTDAQGMCRFAGLRYYGHRDSYVAFASHETMCASEIISLGSDEVQFELRLRPGKPVYGLVRDSLGQPLEGVVVSTHRQLPLAITGADGLFTIPVFPDNSGGLSFAKEGYGWREGFHWTRIEMVMEPGGLIEGRVVDEQGQPLPEAIVSFHAKEGGAELVTDADGNFVTPWIAPSQDIEFSVYRDADNAHWQGRLKCALVAGERRRHVIPTEKQVSAAELTPDEVEQREKERAARFTTVSGRMVLAEKNTPVLGRIFGANTNSNLGEFDYHKCEVGHTDADGRFVIEEVPKLGPFFLMAAPADPLLYGVEGIVQFDPGKGPLEDIVLTVAPGAAIVGTAVYSDGEPVVEGDVIIMGQGSRRDHFLERINRFRFPNLPPGRYFVQLNNTSLDLGELAAGELLENVVLTIPRADDGTLVEGYLLDSGGAPIGGADINFHAGNAHEHAETDAAGHFSVPVKQPGSYRIEAWVSFALARLEQSAGGTGQSVALAGEPTVDVPEEGRVTLALTGTPPPWPQPVIGGRVFNAAGDPIDAQVEFVYEKSRTDYAETQNGAFLTERLPEGPFLLLVKARGYEARVLEADVDFSRTDRGLWIVLEDGPFEETPSIWTQVTGRPATDDALAAMTCAEFVREQLEYYRRDAMPATPAPVSAPAPSAPGFIEVLVTDTDGKPVPRIVLRGEGYVSDPAWYTYYWLAAATQDAAREIMTNKEGRYTVPNGMLIEAEGMAAVRASVKPEETYAPPVKVVLAPPATLVVRVRNYSGEPVKDAVMAPIEILTMASSNDYNGLPSSDARGETRISGVPAGEYVLAVGAKAAADPLRARIQNVMPPRLVALRAEPGKETTADVVVPLGGKNLTAASLALWERGGTRQPEQLAAKLEPLSRGDRNTIAKLVQAQLAPMPVIAQWNFEQAIFLANVAAALGGKDAKRITPELVRILSVGDSGLNQLGAFAINRTQPIVDAIDAIEGAAALKLWGDLARDNAALPAARTHACIMLGKLGSRASVAEWIKLRNEARALPGAPALRDSYTHAEKMVETAQFVFGVFGGDAKAQIAPESAWVDAEYTTGRLNALQTTVHLKRFGDEWMIVGVDPMVMY